MTSWEKVALMAWLDTKRADSVARADRLRQRAAEPARRDTALAADDRNEACRAYGAAAAFREAFVEVAMLGEAEWLR